MNILQGIKSSNPKAATTTTNKFVIKSKMSLKENKQDLPDCESNNYSSNQDVRQFVNYLIAKSKRLTDLLEIKGISDVGDFHNLHLSDNPCIRTLVKALMDKMLAERRLGKNLKGINKGILCEFQNALWPSIEREVTLYQLNKIYDAEKNNLENELKSRKKQIQFQIRQLKNQAEVGVLGEKGNCLVINQ